jgi:hypothetical protein
MRRVGLAGLALVGAFGCVSAFGETDGRVDSAHVTVIYRDIAEILARRLTVASEIALTDITDLLALQPSPRIIIDIGAEYANPKVIAGASRFLLPADRLTGTAGGAPSSRCRGPAVYHNIAMLVAESRQPLHGSMLTNGLGVYLESRFRPPGPVTSTQACERMTDPELKFDVLLRRSYPTMGRDLDDAMADALAEYGRFIPLEDAEQERERHGYGVTTRLALLSEGSFVKFLIEDRGGQERYMQLHRGASFEAIYGRPFAALEADWRQKIEGR